MTPESFRDTRLGLAWGRLIFRLVELRGGRNQLTTTYFFRNRPELDLMSKVAASLTSSSKLSITIIGCSEGAEVFSILYTLDKILPLANIEVNAFDISVPALDSAKAGRFHSSSRLLSLIKQTESDELFEQDDGFFQIKDKYRELIHWNMADPLRKPVLTDLPKQNIVVANRFLFHMKKEEQVHALYAIASLVKPEGYLFISGIDLDIRTRVAEDLGWIPLPDLIEEIHNADETMTMDWPFQYWGLEPLDKRLSNWRVRYCSVFKLPKNE